jgi:hypothetical protein
VKSSEIESDEATLCSNKSNFVKMTSAISI